MVEKVYQFIKQNNMLKNCHTIVTGVSGGADSVCLLHVLHTICKKHNLPIQLVVVHVNHGIRGAEAQRDAAFVKAFSEKLHVVYTEISEDVPAFAKKHRLSEEEAGRVVRYEAFTRIASEYGDIEAVKIAVAHHKEDQAETVLMNLFRGSNLKGVAGMQPVYGQIIRPLLVMNRSQIEQYLQQIHQDFVTDSTNLTDAYLRNRLRNQIIPEITANVNSHAVSHICAFAQTAAEVEAYLEAHTQSIYNHCVQVQGDCLQLSCEALKSVDTFLQKRVIYQAVVEYAQHQKDIYRVHIDAVYELLSGKVASKVNLPYGIVAQKTYTHIILSKYHKNPIEPTKDKEYAHIAIERLQNLTWEEIYDVYLREEIYIDGKLEKIDKISFQRVQTLEKDVENRYTIYFNPYYFQNDLFLRTRRVQDRFYVKGMDYTKNTKKLKKELIDKKVPVQYRDSVLLLAQQEEVLWIVGIRKCVDLEAIQKSNCLVKATIHFL